MRIHTPTANAVPSTLPSKAELPPKAELRDVARRSRAALRDDGFAACLAAQAEALAIAPGTVVAGYHAHQG